jgi:hypothetical protein
MNEEHPARRAAQASMAAVVARDRDAWVGLFAPKGFVEDPVGPSPRLVRRRDEVANVATIHLVLPGGATARTDGVFVYRVDGDGRLASLRAFWEMDRMLGTIAQP